MNFGSRHYMPMLKTKRGEKKALQFVAPALREQMVPFMEIVERNAEQAKSVEQHLDTAFTDFAAALKPYGRFFLDTWEIRGDGPEAAANVYNRADAAQLEFTPVTGISRTADVAACMANRSHGLALRVTRPEFEGGDLAKRLQAFMTQHGLVPAGVDMVVDLGAVGDFVAEGVANLTKEFLGAIPDHAAWRTLTVAGCAFPESMGIVGRDAYVIVERAEWKAWRDALHARRTGLARLPTFADCGIQHPRGVEGFDPKIMQVSAAVRYTLPEDWLLIKGQGTRVLRPGIQFPGLAKRLVHGELKSHFAGKGHCAGCEGIALAAQGANGYGSAEAWRRLGTIHHITRAVESLKSLPWP